MQSIHPECASKITYMSPEDVRAEARLLAGRSVHMALYSSIDTLPRIAGCCIPLFILSGALLGFNFIGERDMGPALFFMIVGAGCGALVGSLIYTWLRMQALLARRIAEYLESH